MAFVRFLQKETSLLVGILLPYSLVLNLLIFGACLFTSLSVFAKVFSYTTIYLFVTYLAFISVAQLIRKCISADSALFRRIAIMLPVFYGMNILFIHGLFLLYQHLLLLPCPAKAHMIWWTILYSCIASTTITFVNEGMANWQNWKASVAETARLKNAYQRSKLLGLKGQLNPHFLFNCFNTLSQLIIEDKYKAEQFLEEMVKVHRYLLRSDNEYLVPLADEVQFAYSYLYLAQVRFGKALRTSVSITTKGVLEKLLPPLSMQVILENIIYANAIGKAHPLTLHIHSIDAQHLYIHHSVQDKTIMTGSFDLYEGLDNLMNKYKLLNGPRITIKETSYDRTIILPVLEKREVRL